MYRPSNTVVAIAGDLPHEEALELAADGVRDGDGAVPAPEPAPELPAGPRVLTGRRDTSQAQLSIALPALRRDHPDAWNLAVLNAVLGDGMSSRLFLGVREEKGLAYDVELGRRGVRRRRGAARSPRAWTPSQLPAAIEAILAELVRLADEPVPADELAKAKAYLSGGLELRMDDTRHLASWIGGQEALHDRVYTLDDALGAVEAVQAERHPAPGRASCSATRRCAWPWWPRASTCGGSNGTCGWPDDGRDRGAGRARTRTRAGVRGGARGRGARARRPSPRPTWSPRPTPAPAPRRSRAAGRRASARPRTRAGDASARRGRARARAGRPGPARRRGPLRSRACTCAWARSPWPAPSSSRSPGRAASTRMRALDLAEVRWRTGDLAGAGRGRQGGDRPRASRNPLAFVIAAEAVAALGRPAEARRLSRRALDRDGRLDGRPVRRHAAQPHLAGRRDPADEGRRRRRRGRRPRALGRGRPGADRVPPRPPPRRRSRAGAARSRGATRRPRRCGSAWRSASSRASPRACWTRSGSARPSRRSPSSRATRCGSWGGSTRRSPRSTRHAARPRPAGPGGRVADAGPGRVPRLTRATGTCPRPVPQRATLCLHPTSPRDPGTSGSAHSTEARSPMAELQRTLLLVKPDGVQRQLVGRVLTRFEERGLKLVGLKLVHVDRALAEQHYAVHSDKPFFRGLVDFITSGPLVAAALEGPNAIAIVRAMNGATRPHEAAPGSIRGDFAVETAQNLVHASDSPENAAAELALWFAPGSCSATSARSTAGCSPPRSSRRRGTPAPLARS